MTNFAPVTPSPSPTMRKNFIITLQAFIVLTAMCCCSMANKDNNSNKVNKGGDTTMCQFSNFKQVKMFKYADEDGKTFFIDNKVTGFWPVIINGKPCPELQKALLLAMTDSAELNTLDLVVEALLKPGEYLDITPGTLKPVDEVVSDGANISSGEVTLRLQDMGERLLTYHIHRYYYAALAAHGIYANNYVTYDQKTEKAVAMTDVIADTTMLRIATLKSIKQTLDYDTDDLFLPDNGLLPLPSDFYIEDNTLHVVYQVYEIASYAQGMIDAPIYPYMLKPEQMKRLFTPYGLELIDYSE